MQKYIVDLVATVELNRGCDLNLAELFPKKLLGITNLEGIISLDQLLCYWRPSTENIKYSMQNQTTIKIGLLHDLSLYGEKLWKIYLGFLDKIKVIKMDLVKEDLFTKFKEYMRVASLYSSNMQALTHDIEYLLQEIFKHEIYVFPIGLQNKTFLICSKEEVNEIIKKSKEYTKIYI